jgi:hypothetical protein
VQGFEGQLSDFLAHFISKKLIKASNFSNLSNIQEPLPKLIQERPRYRGRVKSLPEKYLAAIMASELASSLVYHGGQEANFMEMVKGHINRSFVQKYSAA